MPLLHDFFSLLYPRLCMACESGLQKHEQVLCTFCRYHLPKTNFHQEKNNIVEQLFWGKVDIATATSYYFFHKAGKVQNLIHEFKYKGHKNVGLYIGKQLAMELLNSNRHNNISYVLPVPLHPKKMRKRGFNQSEVFAEGIAKKMGIHLDNKTLYRTKFTQTQTKKSRFERWKNVYSKFDVRNSEHLNGQEVLLVDDVITTGSTIEACAQALLQIEGIKIHIASIAYTS